MSDTSNAQDDSSLDVPTNDEDGTPKPGGLGDDSTIPNHPEGVAAGFSETDSHFNHEEDPEHD
ncbi:hypothetical protein [Curtobacterium sp. DN_7.5]|uniref:hypothetical protein n=1 Tax=Curtobacterium sp. DN_7.5 TaxID=3049047 RepID=UPI001F5A8338|nr:hypothetical protein [Curtobacterium sp. DN_7.5]